MLIAIGGLATMFATVLSALVGSANAFGADLGWLTTIGLLARRHRRQCRRVRRRLLGSAWTPQAVARPAPGALTAAIVWQVLQLLGTAYVGRVVKGTTVTYGAFTLVLGLLAWIFLAAVALVLGAELDVVRYKHLYPRSLLTPFTDDVELTRADRHTYADIATAQQAKGFESVSVRFGRRRRRRGATTPTRRTGVGGRAKQRRTCRVAERVGFEPTDHLAAVNALAGAPFGLSGTSPEPLKCTEGRRTGAAGMSPGACRSGVEEVRSFTDVAV